MAAWLRRVADRRGIPAELSTGGVCFGHSIQGSASFEVVQFMFEFYGFATYNALFDPNNPLALAVLTAMVESGDYFFFAHARQRLRCWLQALN
jgi:hypothetical protein